MKKILIIYCLVSIGLAAFSQDVEKWIAFRAADSKLIGYKNSKGEVVIQPRFEAFTAAKTFENIIAVSERVDGKKESYYLTKTGKKVGRDSVYFFDFCYDCEYEGFIRFSKNEKTGMLDKYGDVAIPAIYDWLSRKNNGLIWATKDAEKEFMHKQEEGGCSHFKWVNGKELLLNENNEILIENFKYQNGIDLYSLQIEDRPSTKSNHNSFKGVNGKYYVFKNTKKDFEEWMRIMVTPELDEVKLTAMAMDSIAYVKKGEGWITENKEAFLERNTELIKERLTRIFESDSKYFFHLNSLNFFLYLGKNYEKYYNNCGEPNYQKYPVITLVIREGEDGELKSDRIEFLKTDEGYKLIGMNITTREIKQQ